MEVYVRKLLLVNDIKQSIIFEKNIPIKFLGKTIRVTNGPTWNLDVLGSTFVIESF